MVFCHSIYLAIIKEEIIRNECTDRKFRAEKYGKTTTSKEVKKVEAKPKASTAKKEAAPKKETVKKAAPKKADK